MASKSGSKKKSSKKKSKNRKRFSDEQRSVIRIVAGVIFTFVCIFTTAALVSYAFSWNVDQSIKTNEVMWNAYVRADNICGKLGFEWADFLVSKLFGLGAFFLPIFMGLLAIACFRIRRVKIFRAFIINLFGCILFSVIAAYFSSFFQSGLLLPSGIGGSYGNLANLWLTSVVGPFGAGAVLAFLLFIWLILLTKKVALWFDKFLYCTFHKEKPLMSVDDADEKNEDENEDNEEDEEDEADNEAESEKEELETEAISLEIEDDYLNESSKPEPEPSTDAESVELVIESNEHDYLANLSDDDKAHIYDPRLDLSSFQFPSMSMLDDYRSKQYEVSREELEKNKVRIVNALNSYKIKVDSIAAKRGPTVTLYRIRLAEGIRIATVKKLEEDIAISLGAKGVRVLTLSDAIGIEVANNKPSIVPLKAILNSQAFIEQSSQMELPVALGITVTNEPFFLDVAKMPHLLVAGATGTGKSVGLNSIITSLLFAKHPCELKFVMVDPKKVELDFYNALEKHYLAKLPDEEEAIITDTNKVVRTLKSLCIEMDNRYELLRAAGERKITAYNEKFLNRKLNPLKGHVYLPYIVVIIDEFADLLMSAGREVEEPIARLAQK
ncbi:MAG: DNA translocase FtsK [Bacteroidales bacterium]|nr:DNA translocase FtsK [Bacteroidales bacterium]